MSKKVILMSMIAIILLAMVEGVIINHLFSGVILYKDSVCVGLK